MTIQFNQIPAVLGVPGQYVEFDGSQSLTTTGGTAHSVLIFAPMAAPKTALLPNGATVPANIPRLMTSADNVATAFGLGTVAHHMASTHFKTNSSVLTYFVGQTDDAAGVARVLTADYATAYTAAATIAGVERLYVGEQEYRVSVAVGATGAVVAAAMQAVIAADTTALFTATVAGAVLTLTAKTKGELLNDVQVVANYYDTDASPAGAFVQVVQATAGVQNPDITASLASCAQLNFTHVVMPYNDTANAALILAEAQARWSAVPASTALGQGQNDFMIFGAYRGSEAAAQTFMSTRNSEHRTTLFVEPEQTISAVKYAGLMSSAWQAATAYAATSAALTATVANKPHQNQTMAYLKAATTVTRGSWAARNRAILSYGMATYKYNGDGQVVLEAGITESTMTANGTPSAGERRIETQFAKSYLRSSLRSMLDLKFPNYRLADNGTRGLPNDVATPDMIAMAIIGLAKSDWVAKGIMEDLSGFTNSLIVERSTSDCNTVNIQVYPNLVNILSVVAVKISYIVC